jgi:hypothetical protein
MGRTSKSISYLHQILEGLMLAPADALSQAVERDAKPERRYVMAVCTENLNPDVMVMKSAQDGT